MTGSAAGRLELVAFARNDDATLRSSCHARRTADAVGVRRHAAVELTRSRRTEGAGLQVGYAHSSPARRAASVFAVGAGRRRSSNTRFRSTDCFASTAHHRQQLNHVRTYRHVHAPSFRAPAAAPAKDSSAVCGRALAVPGTAVCPADAHDEAGPHRRSPPPIPPLTTPGRRAQRFSSQRPFKHRAASRLRMRITRPWSAEHVIVSFRQRPLADPRSRVGTAWFVERPATRLGLRLTRPRLSSSDRRPST